MTYPYIVEKLRRIEEGEDSFEQKKNKRGVSHLERLPVTFVLAKVR